MENFSPQGLGLGRRDWAPETGEFAGAAGVRRNRGNAPEPGRRRPSLIGPRHDKGAGNVLLPAEIQGSYKISAGRQLCFKAEVHGKRL